MDPCWSCALLNQVLTAQIIKRPWSRPGLKHCDISSTKYTERLISKSWTACEKCACNPFVPHGFAHTKLIISKITREARSIRTQSQETGACIRTSVSFSTLKAASGELFSALLRSLSTTFHLRAGSITRIQVTSQSVLQNRLWHLTSFPQALAIQTMTSLHVTTPNQPGMTINGWKSKFATAIKKGRTSAHDLLGCLSNNKNLNLYSIAQSRH